LEGLEEVSGPSAEFEDRPPRLNHRSEGTFKVVVVAAVAPVPAVAVGGEPIVVSPNSGFELPVVLVDARQGRLPPIVEGVHT
jgi:hypothetical protein